MRKLYCHDWCQNTEGERIGASETGRDGILMWAQIFVAAPALYCRIQFAYPWYHQYTKSPGIWADFSSGLLHVLQLLNYFSMLYECPSCRRDCRCEFSVCNLKRQKTVIWKNRKQVLRSETHLKFESKKIFLLSYSFRLNSIFILSKP